MLNKLANIFLLTNGHIFYRDPLIDWLDRWSSSEQMEFLFGVFDCVLKLGLRLRKRYNLKVCCGLCLKESVSVVQ